MIQPIGTGAPVARIRAARSNEATAMVGVRREAILSKARGAYHQSVIEAWAAESTPDRAVRYQEEIADPNIVVLVAESDDEVIGFATADPAKAELSAIYVKPNRIGRIGHALLSQVEKRAFRIAEALTCIAALNAVQFYRANGYIDQGNIDYVDGSGAAVPCMQMKKTRASLDAKGTRWTSLSSSSTIITSSAGSSRR